MYTILLRRRSARSGELHALFLCAKPRSSEANSLSVVSDGDHLPNRRWVREWNLGSSQASSTSPSSGNLSRSLSVTSTRLSLNLYRYRCSFLATMFVCGERCKRSKKNPKNTVKLKILSDIFPVAFIPIIQNSVERSQTIIIKLTGFWTVFYPTKCMNLCCCFLLPSLLLFINNFMLFRSISRILYQLGNAGVSKWNRVESLERVLCLPSYTFIILLFESVICLLAHLVSELGLDGYLVYH